MAYKIRITEPEMESLGFIADRYNYASVLYDALKQDDEDEDLWHLSEADAWEFNDAVEDEDGYLPLMGGELATKVQAILDNIV